MSTDQFDKLKQQGLEQSRMTAELRDQADRMEADRYPRSREVAEASLELKQANEDLARLYNKSRELNGLKSRIFANVSHELRTPLTLILSPVERLLKSEGQDEKARSDLLIVQRNARLLKGHLNELMDVAN